MSAVVQYRRVSTTEQNLDRQLVESDVTKVFDEKTSGKDRDRPVLADALAYVREGDTFRVHSADRLARSLPDLLHVTKQLTDAGVRVEFVKEQLAFDPASPDPFAKCMLSMLGAFAELERELILSRQAEGIALAKARGAYGAGGRKPALSPSEVANAKERRDLGVPLARLCRDHRVSKATMQDALAGRGPYAKPIYMEAIAV